MTSNILTNTNNFSIILNAKFKTYIYAITLLTLLCILFIEENNGLYQINKWPGEMPEWIVCRILWPVSLQCQQAGAKGAGARGDGGARARAW